MTELDALHAHQEEHHKIVVQALRYVAREADVPYSIVRDDFITGGHEITEILWHILHRDYPGLFCGVSWCHCCRKFNLQEVIH